MTLKNKRTKQDVNKNVKHSIGLSNKNKLARIFIGLANPDANNVISPRNFLESDRHFTLMSFESVIKLFTAHIRSFLGRNKEKLCFNLAKHWSVKQLVHTFSRSYECCSNNNNNNYVEVTWPSITGARFSKTSNTFSGAT